MNRHVFSFCGMLIVATGGLLALPPTSSAQQPVPIYQPPFSSLPNFGYYNPAPSYRPGPFYLPSSGYRSSRMYGGHYHLYHEYIPHMARIPRDEKPPPDLRAHLTMLVPADAELWFNGTKVTGEEGSVRKFASPPLEPGQRYSYEVRARWQKDGQTITTTREVNVRAGTRINVDFTKPEDMKK
jgi:uncharacterized protein (TIGR03000 family)